MSKIEKYYVWESSPSKDANRVTATIENFTDSHHLLYGVSVIDSFPEYGILEMDSDFPDCTELDDNVGNPGSFILVSKKLKDFLDEEKLSGVEYLPVKIKNLKGEITDAAYYIIHLLDHGVDVIDREKSGAEMDIIDPDAIDSVTSLHFKNLEKLPEQRLFVTFPYQGVQVVAESLKKKIEDQGFTGLMFYPTEEHSTY